MKKKFIYYLAVAAICLGSCKKEFLNVNTNPNSAAVSRSDFEFTGAVATTASNMVAQNLIGGAWGGIYGISTSFTGAGAQRTYIFSNADFTFWDGMYQNINNYKYVIDNGAAEGFPNLVGPARVMQSYLYATLVDMYNNIPFTQSLNPAFITPAYDKGQVVYDSVIARIDAAIALMKGQTWAATNAADIMFTGNKTNWIKLANSIKLRMFMRESLIPANASKITTGIAAIVAEGSGFLDADAFIKPGYLKAAGKTNPYYINLGYNENDVEQQNHQLYKVNNFLIDMLKATNDNFRLVRKADPRTSTPDPTVQANFVGIPTGGTGSTYATSLTSAIGSSLITKGEATRPSIFFTAAESYFLRAEAVTRFGTTALGDAQTLYESGIKAAFVLDAGNGTSPAPTATVAASQTAAVTYYSQPINNVGWLASTNKINAIITQKWISLANFNNFEAWTEWRRTGIPPVPLSVSPAANPVQPRRLYYPISESNTNQTVLNAEGTINPYSSKIFWDVR